MRKILDNKYTIIILFILSAILVILFLPDRDYIKVGKLYINEVLPSNTNVIRDDELEYSDYIELYNGYNYDIDLSNYHLSDNEYDTNKWTFTDAKIKANSYLIVYASGKDYCSNNVCHTNFKLSSSGEVLTLTDPANNIISKIEYKEVNSNISYGYIKGKYKYLQNPTPGESNDSEEVVKVNIKDYTLRINEYILNNKSNYLSDGGYYDFIEIYNYGDKDLNLKGIYLSDDIEELSKFKLPNVVIKSKDYLVVYMGCELEDYICSNFKLSSKDDNIIISGNNKIIDKVKINNLLDGVSSGYTEDGWLMYPTPTPGKENSTKGFESIGGTNGNS